MKEWSCLSPRFPTAVATHVRPPLPTKTTGQPTAAAQELVAVTHASLQAAIDVCGPGAPFKAIGDAICRVADAAGVCVCPQELAVVADVTSMPG